MAASPRAAKTIAEAQAERVAKAARLLAEGAYVDAGSSVLVYSDAPGRPGWTVAHDRCDCPDATVGWAARHLGGVCKHVECVRMLRRRRDGGDGPSDPTPAPRASCFSCGAPLFQGVCGRCDRDLTEVVESAIARMGT